jgi:hypothetical protein
MTDQTARRTVRGAALLVAAATAALGLQPLASEAAPAGPSVTVTCGTSSTNVTWSRTKLATLSVTWVRADGVREIHDLTSQLGSGKKGTVSYPTPATSQESWATYKTTPTGAFTDTATVPCG